MDSKYLRIFLLIVCVWSVNTLCAQTVYYVKEGATGQGTSWENAAGNLQAIINRTVAGDKIYVAAGRYYATDGDLVKDERSEGTVMRQRSFVMKAGVQVYGGFSGTNMSETPATRVRVEDARYGWQLRDSSVLTGTPKPPLSQTNDNWYFDHESQCWVPSGYLMDNVLHVVWFATAGFDPLVEGEATGARPLAAETVLDGFVIEGGAADGNETTGGIQGHSARFGGGVYLVGNGVLRNCVVRNNYAQTRGGGVFLSSGGLVSDCCIEGNASPGVGTRNGFGGGVYVLGKGKVERSFVVNNSARIGGGVYCARDKQPLPYEITLEMSVIANNTAAHEAGGIYCDKGGVLTGLVIARNYTLSAGGEASDYGKTGGLYCNNYGVVTNTVMWNNSSSAGSRQFYAKDVVAATGTSPASVQLYGCAIQNQARENYGNATLSVITDMDDQTLVSRPHFILDPEISGILDGGAYLEKADWDKGECSALLKNGVVPTDAPFLDGELRADVPLTTIDGKKIGGRPDVGPYVNEGVMIESSWNEEVKAWVVYVDRVAKVCGNGSSWDSPTKLPRMAIDHLLTKAEKGERVQVWIKEGFYLPLAAAFGNVSVKDYFLEMKSGVDVYGGFPQHLQHPKMSDRNPVLYRTTLSSDIGVRGDAADNAWHVVVFTDSVTRPTVLDGICMMDANAAGEGLNHGGAVVVMSHHAVIRNCIIENNWGGIGAAVWSDKPFKMVSCVVNNNSVFGQDAAVMELAEGTELMNLTVVMNKGIGIHLLKGKIINTVIWGNTGNAIGEGFDDVQITGLPTITYSALSNVLTGNNVYLSKSLTGESAPHFENPTMVAGVIPYGGYATLLGGPAVFRPNCISALVNKASKTEFPAADITGKVVSTDFSGIHDIGAYNNDCLPSGPRVRYVKQGGSGEGRGFSWDNASDDINLMTESLLNDGGGEVWVAGGTYGGPFEMPEGVNVYGGFPNFGTPGMKERRPVSTDPAYRTRIESTPGGGRVLEQTGHYTKPTVWDGFTIQGGRIGITSGDDGGAGVKLLTNGRLENCVITDNVNAGEGNKSITVLGGGVYNDGGELVNCYITGNEVKGTLNFSFDFSKQLSVYGAGLYMKSGKAYNCVIADNTAAIDMGFLFGGTANAYGGGVYVETGDFFNNTITHNKATTTGIFGTGNSASGVRIGEAASIMNCIVWGNTGTAEQITGKAGAVTYSCVQGGYATGTGNIADDPKFEGADDFHLTDGSPAINTGNTYPVGVKLPATDMDYTSRIKDCAVDMGAYEYDDKMRIRPQVVNDTAVVYVTRYGAGRADGSSWEQAVCGEKLQDAIHTMAAGKEKVKQVWVGVGVDLINAGVWSADFYPTEPLDVLMGRSYTFQIDSGVVVIGGFRGDEKHPDERMMESQASPVTLLNGDILRTPDNREDDAYHVAVVYAGARLESFLVVNGYANHFSDMVYQNGGGLVIRGKGVVRNCYVWNCYASGKGGGIYMESRAKLTGSIVTGNEAAAGGGVYAASWAELTANTIVKNTGQQQGGGVCFVHPVSIQGCVLWGNTGKSAKDISGNTELPYEPEIAEGDSVGSYYPVNYSAIEGLNIVGEGNMSLSADNDADSDSPHFVDPGNVNGGWRLQTNSPLIDRGINIEKMKMGSVDDALRLLDLSKRDMAGKARVKTVHPALDGNYMDAGAYEADYEIQLEPAEVDGKKRLYVTYTSRGKMNGSSWKDGISDVQSALNYFKTARVKGEVWVQGGYSYVPIWLIDSEQDPRAMSFVLNRYVNVYGGFKGDAENGPDMLSETALDQRVRYDRNRNGIVEDFEYRYPTILDGMIKPLGGDRNAYHVFYYNDAEATEAIVMNGLTVANGYADGIHGSGGGLYAMSPVRVENCVFWQNYAKRDGGAVWCHHPLTTLPSVIQNSSFGGNNSDGNGGAVSLNNGLILNTNLFNNTAKVRGGSVDAENTVLLNSVVARSEAAEGAGVYLNGGSITNTVVWGNAGGKQVAVGSGPVVITYSAVGNGDGLSGEDAVTHNIRLNDRNDVFDGPRFVAPTEHAGVAGYDWMSDWTVHQYSPLVDHGDNGAYKPEYPQTVHHLLYSGETVQIPVNRVENGTIDIGSYEHKRSLLKENLNRMYVRTWEDNVEDSDGSSWKKATSDLQGAIETLEASTASGPKEIWVAGGEYIPIRSADGSADLRMRSFMITKGGIRIYGGFPDDGTGLEPTMAERNTRKYMTVLDGRRMDNYHVMRIEGLNPVLLDGFFILGGKGAVDGGWDSYGSGAWIQNPKTTVNHCIFTQNEGTGGALYMNGENMRVENSLFYSNTGYAVWMEKGHFLNNTVVGNTRGVLLRGGEMANCVIWGNNGEVQLDVEPVEGLPAPLVRYNAVAGRWEEAWQAEHNIPLADENDSAGGPRFMAVGDWTTLNLRLNCGSVLIDAGDQGVKLTDTVDLETQPRVRGGAIDIGAYESTRGPIPEKPDYQGLTATCQGTPLLLTIDNSGYTGTKIYWTRAGTDINVGVNEDPVTVSGTLPGGTIPYQAVRVDMSTLCQSEAADVAVTIHASPEVVLSGAGSICSGDDAVLSFVPVNGARAYRLYEGEVLLAELTAEQAQAVVEHPAAGEHFYQLTAVMAGTGCESLRSDTVKVVVHKMPVLTNGGRLLDVVSGNTVRFLPESDVPGFRFEWSRKAVEGIENEAATGRDSIHEVLINRTLQPILVTYLCRMNVNGCTGTKEYSVTVAIQAGIGTPEIVRAYGGCGDGKIYFEVKPAQGIPVNCYCVYNKKDELVARRPDASPVFSILAPSGVYYIQAEGNIGSETYESIPTPAVELTVHPAVTPITLSPSAASYCSGDNVVLTSSRAAAYYKLYDGPDLLDSTRFRVDAGRKMTLFAPAVGPHTYRAVVVEKHPDGAVCESTESKAVTGSVLAADRVIVAEGSRTVNSHEVTNITLRYGDAPPATSFVWELVANVVDVAVVRGEKSGLTMAMTLVNYGSEPKTVVFRVRDVSETGGGCVSTLDVAVTVYPLQSLVLETTGTDNQKVCPGDAIVDIVYMMTGSSGCNVTGLPAGVTFRVVSGRVTISGTTGAAGTYAYTVTSGGAVAQGNLTVYPKPEFELGN